MNSKSPLARLIKRADTVFSLWIRARDGRCVCCGSIDNLQAGHLIKRGRWVTRFDPDNVHGQCASCNFKHNEWPEEMHKAVLNKIGRVRYEALIDRAREIKKKTKSDVEEIIQRYQ